MLKAKSSNYLAAALVLKALNNKRFSMANSLGAVELPSDVGRPRKEERKKKKREGQRTYFKKKKSANRQDKDKNDVRFR